MSETPAPPKDQTPSEIPLEDIDALLASEDPEFAKSLEEVRAVAPDANITIEASAVDDTDTAGEIKNVNEEALAETRFAKFKVRVKLKWRAYWSGLRMRLRARSQQAGKDLVIFLKTRPKEFLLFSIAMSKTGFKNAMVPVRAFQDASATQRLAVLMLVATLVGSLWVLLANFKGIWLPHIHEPILASFAANADHVETFDAKDNGESFYSAFPQERHEFLFPKMKVNLRPTQENPLPMGAFEIVVQLDSMDTAIEVRDREVEFNDLLQRACEEETFSDLETELGKSRLKSLIKRELNQKLTQGWIKDVNFKTFILKP